MDDALDSYSVRERQAVVAMLHAIGSMKQAIREFEDGEINIHLAWQRIVLATGQRAAA